MPASSGFWTSRAAYFLPILLWSVLMLDFAWVAEDAFITFRTLDNFVHGFGLRWNINERVQTYTNPLWLFLHVPFYALWPNIDYVTMGLGFACTLGAVVLSIWTLGLSPMVLTIFLLGPIVVSGTLSTYSFSGLENSLSNLLFCAFGFVLWRDVDRPRWGWLSLIVALSMVNRLDMVVIYVPVLLYLVWTRRKDVAWGAVLLGSLPLVAWFAFSLFYYGFLFPNTKYAKLGTGVSQWQYVLYGVDYLINFVLMDPLMAVVMAGVFGRSVFVAWRRPSVRAHVLLGLGMGMVGYCLYVMSVGGSFISCRYMSLPTFMGLWIGLAQMGRVEKRVVIAGVEVLVLVMWLQHSGFLRRVQHANIVSLQGNVWQLGQGRFYGGAYDDIKKGSMRSAQLKQCRVGQDGFKASRQVYIVDSCGLGNALLARLPADQYLAIGHAYRFIPLGYVEAVQTGDLQGMQPELAQYYDKLRLVISGDLWDGERLRAIGGFATGEYDHWRDAYVASVPADAGQRPENHSDQPPLQFALRPH